MRRLFVFLAVLSVSVLFHSCGKEEEFDETLLIGRWQPVSGTRQYFTYYRGGTGTTWNPDEEVWEEDPGGDFTWELVKSELTQIHLMETVGGVVIPKVYTVTELTATSLKYKDRFSSYSFSKIP